jgi:glycosyltransferase involved in cell wall biosynthesis
MKEQHMNKKAMRIGVASLGRISEDTGGRNYIEHFFRTLQTIKQPHHFTLFLSEGEREQLDLGAYPPEIVVINNSKSTPLHKVWGEQFKLRNAIQLAGIDRMYFPGNFASRNCPVPYVLNVRATTHYYGKALGIDFTRRFIRKRLMPFSARRAAAIITPSEAIKKDVVRFTGASAEKITVIPHGVDTSLFDGKKNRADAEGLKTLSEFKLESGKYLLYVSALWRYKNQDKLIRAHAALVKKKRLQYPLVIAGLGTGTEKTYLDQLYNLPQSLGTEDLVIFTGQLPQSKLRYLYAHARAFIFPSSYESFGNPIFESWASGIPIATANVHSFPEITGGAAILFDPLDTAAMQLAMESVSLDEEKRRTLVRLGNERVRMFSWELCVRRTLSLLESV